MAPCLNNTISGGAHGSGDTVVLDNAGALSFDASRTINFELLVKNNIGEATLTGAQSYVGGATLNGGILSVAGTLDTPSVAMADGAVLNVERHIASRGRRRQSSITGSAGVNTVNVGAGGTLLATGDLGDGADVLDVAGTLDTGGGVFALGAGNDNFIVHDGTVTGTVDGGAGLDTRTYNINTSADLGCTGELRGCDQDRDRRAQHHRPGRD